MSLNSSDDQTDKKTLQAKIKTNPGEQGFKDEKSSEKAKKEKKKKGRQGWRKKPNPATRANAAPLTDIGGEGQKKKKKPRDISEITCYSCNKKSYYVSDYTKPKN